jgi:hypothetical protein
MVYHFFAPETPAPQRFTALCAKKLSYEVHDGPDEFMVKHIGLAAALNDSGYTDTPGEPGDSVIVPTMFQQYPEVVLEWVCLLYTSDAADDM